MSASFIDNNLPMSLSEKEQSDLLKKISVGDLAARKLLIESNIRLVLFQVIHRFSNTSEDMQDLISEGIIGLIKAVDTFDISKNNTFTTYAVPCINNEVLMYLRGSKKKSLDISMEMGVGFGQDGKELLIKDIISVDNDVEEECILNNMLEQMMEEISCLTEYEQELLTLYFGLNGNAPCKQKDIANIYGISKACVSRQIQDILAKLQNRLEKPKGIGKTKK